MMEGDSTFEWKKASFSFKKYRQPLRSIVAHVRLVDKDFRASCGKAHEALHSFIKEHELLNNVVQDGTAILNYPEDPSKEGTVYVQPGVILTESADILKMKSFLDDGEMNPLADPSDAKQGRLFRLFDTGDHEWAVYHIKGSYRQISPAFDEAFSQLPSFGYAPAWENAPGCFDLYHNSPMTISEEELLTDIHIPVKNIHG